ncbi:MAG TPA: hypothetical protein DCQ34_10495 [Chitinophagaceae bacterium]|nr:hypothetical protein [Chitinophagaceae bacterium]
MKSPPGNHFTIKPTTMKRLTTVLALAVVCSGAKAQTGDSTDVKKPDTIRIGNIVIIKKKGDGKKSIDINNDYTSHSPKKKSRVKTNWGVIDLGFANYTDKTDYTAVGNYLVNRPGYPAINGNDLKLRTGKSVNVNIWFFMQQLSLIKENVNLKWGLGLELNNYRYRSDISYKEDGPIPYSNGQFSNAPFIFRDSIGFSKNKLAADYLTVPVMLNFATNHKPGKKPFIISFGVSAGYLYSQRNKQKSEARGKEKNKGDYDLEKFKLSYIGEIGLGPVKFYASYAPKSMYENAMDIRPYTFGLRFSN